MAQEFPQFDLVEELEAAVGAGAQPAIGAGAQAAGAARNALRWTNAISSFMLRRMC